MLKNRSRKNRAFSLLELVIVVVIIGIIAAIAIPRMSRGSAGAADSALSGDVAVLRNAIDLFAAEHGGKYPKLASITTQLTQYTDSLNTSTPSATKDPNYPYGPYIRVIPKLKVGANKNSDVFGATLGSGTYGWCYSETTGEIKANCADAEVDGAGTKYNTY